ncbi:WD domain G-beta repeat protein [Theileria parva strain Muguga]|uniref:Pre-mRNA-processing factor 17 n=1 Tax=Theileria parva TaxID=5875 RepID=Q4N581_THEPA|nr:WD domain G-beta repeat protein [Theileria parva strain Muguga]EAN32692.1 WD domain G-beta repeat protein [Theileria parva strain Muguga]|eukprot:XP_764975.1 hypothetical protein [Theileria parva strain Muguga]
MGESRLSTEESCVSTEESCVSTEESCVSMGEYCSSTGESRLHMGELAFNSAESGSEIQILSAQENDTKLSCKSRLYSDYHLTPHTTNSLNSLTNTHSNKQRGEREGTIARVRDDDSGVLSVQLGTRHNSSGILTIPITNTNTNTISNSIGNSTENVVNEHVRMEMMYENYAVDDVRFRGHSAAESYARDGSNFCNTASLGGVNVTPSGIAEKIYFNPTAFHNTLNTINNMNTVNTLNTVDNTVETPSVSVSVRRRLRREEVGEDIFGPWIPYEEAELPVHSGAPATENKLENKVKVTVGRGLVKCTPEQAEGMNEVITADGKQFTQFNSLTVSTYNKKIDNKYKPILTKSTVTKSTHMHSRDVKNYIPKSEICVMTGHTMSVYRIEFIPAGNLLLSCGMDGFVKLWDLSTHKCVRNYKAHVKGVRDISFIETGTKFYSLSFDNNAILWDTEYGKIIGVYRIDKTPYCLTPCPVDSNIFLVGGDNNKILQLDNRTGDCVLEYSEHMGCVNTVTFIDHRRLVTTADDKRILVWDYNIPVVVKSISSPEIHTIPAVAAHPSHKFILAQSMDNQILVYETSSSRFKLFGRKRFRGHQNSGYAIKPSCSGDGRFVVSGDSRGKLFIWDWKTCKLLQTFNAHKMALMDSKWHPNLNSTVATASWDGTIKLFQ